MELNIQQTTPEMFGCNNRVPECQSNTNRATEETETFQQGVLK